MRLGYFFNRLFNQKSSQLLGLDISSVSVKVIELSRQSDSFMVESFGVVPLPAKAIDEGHILNSDAVAKAIGDVVKLAAPSSRLVATAVSPSVALTKVVQVEHGLSESELEAQIMLHEAPRILPFPIEEASLDFQVLGPNSAQPHLMDVLITAARSEHVNERVIAIESAGLEVKVVDISSYVMERACQLILTQLPDSGVNKTIAVVDIGSVSTQITILHNNETIYSREESFGSYQLTETIQQRYSLTFAEAGLAKKQGQVAEDYELEVLDPFRQSLISLVRRSLQFFFSAHHSVERVDHILLAGGGALTSKLAPLLAQEMEIAASIANPFAQMKVAPKVDVALLKSNAPMLMLCAGLALRSFTDGHH